MCPDCIRSARAFSSTKPPLAQLIILTPFLVFLKFSRLKIFFVASVKGTWRVMKSDFSNSSLSSTLSIPILSAFSSLRKGSYASTFICRARALSQTIPPILPAPMTPSVFLVSSTPINFDFSHFP